MMIRNDWYGMYQGREYEINNSQASGYIVRSYGEEDISQGWRAIKQNGKNGKYVKNVTKDEIENPVDITTVAIYKGVKFPVTEESKDTMQLLLNDGFNGVAAEKAGFTEIEPAIWEKWVDKNDPDLEKIYEEVRPLELK